MGFRVLPWAEGLVRDTGGERGYWGQSCALRQVIRHGWGQLDVVARMPLGKRVHGRQVYEEGRPLHYGVGKSDGVAEGAGGEWANGETGPGSREEETVWVECTETRAGQSGTGGIQETVLAGTRRRGAGR